MKTSEHLRKTKELLGAPERWLKFSLQNIGGTAHCALGGLYKTSGHVVNHDGRHFSATAISYLAQAIPPETQIKLVPCIGEKFPFVPNNYQSFVVMYNNHEDTDHPALMSWFDRAIELAESKEAWEDLKKAEARGQEREVRMRILMLRPLRYLDGTRLIS